MRDAGPDIDSGPEDAGLTIDLQDGVSPGPEYSGTRDTTLYEGSPGLSHGADGTCDVDAFDSESNGAESTAIAWDVSMIPAGNRVVSVSVTLTPGIAGDEHDSFEIYELLRPWVELDATWIDSSAGTPWEIAGARGGSDRGLLLGIIPANPAPAGAPPIIAPLNERGVAVVQRWIDDPPTNYGVIIASDDNDNGVRIQCRETAIPTERPRLTIGYSPR